MVAHRKKLRTTQKVLELIRRRWPLNPIETARLLRDRGNTKTSSSKYLYHFKKLDKMGLIKLKKFGNNYIAWPKSLERMRSRRKTKAIIRLPSSA
jgi:repressor of nif and glnA expression